jgi:hypothetical protein
MPADKWVGDRIGYDRDIQAAGAERLELKGRVELTQLEVRLRMLRPESPDGGG